MRRRQQTYMPSYFDDSTLMRFNHFGPALRALRTQVGLTQTELARAACCSTALISRIEAGTRKPDAMVLSQFMLPALGVDSNTDIAQHLIALAQARREMRGL